MNPDLYEEIEKLKYFSLLKQKSITHAQKHFKVHPSLQPNQPLSDNIMYPVFYEINRTRALCIGEINLTRAMCINEINQSRRLFFNEINLTRMMFESRVKQLEEKVSENVTELSVANKKIDLLQSFCIANGLEVPFWNSTYPPSADVSSMESLAAATAVACANFALASETDAEGEKEYTDIMNSIKDFGDAYDGSYGHAYGGYYGYGNKGMNNLDFIPVPRYEEDASTSEANASSDYEEEYSEDEDESAYDP